MRIDRNILFVGLIAIACIFFMSFMSNHSLSDLGSDMHGLQTALGRGKLGSGASPLLMKGAGANSCSQYMAGKTSSCGAIDSSCPNCPIYKYCDPDTLTWTACNIPGTDYPGNDCSQCTGVGKGSSPLIMKGSTCMPGEDCGGNTGGCTDTPNRYYDKITCARAEKFSGQCCEHETDCANLDGCYASGHTISVSDGTWKCDEGIWVHSNCDGFDDSGDGGEEECTDVDYKRYTKSLALGCGVTSDNSVMMCNCYPDECVGNNQCFKNGYRLREYVCKEGVWTLDECNGPVCGNGLCDGTETYGSCDDCQFTCSEAETYIKRWIDGDCLTPRYAESTICCAEKSCITGNECYSDGEILDNWVCEQGWWRYSACNDEATPYCGDGNCDIGENPTDCPGDCPSVSCEPICEGDQRCIDGRCACPDGIACILGENECDSTEHSTRTCDDGCWGQEDWVQCDEACASGRCVGCTDDSHCPGQQGCTEYFCNPATNICVPRDVECPSGQTCSDGVCNYYCDPICQGAQSCESGVCRCPAGEEICTVGDSDCDGNNRRVCTDGCWGAADYVMCSNECAGGICVDCISNSDCNDGNPCTTDTCIPEGTAKPAMCRSVAVDCPDGKVCESSTGNCVTSCESPNCNTPDGCVEQGSMYSGYLCNQGYLVECGASDTATCLLDHYCVCEEGDCWWVDGCPGGSGGCGLTLGCSPLIMKMEQDWNQI